MTLRCFWMMLLVCSMLAGCSPGDDPEHDDNQDHAAAEADGPAAVRNRIDIPPTVRQNLGITFADVERRHIANTIRMPGAFELEPLARREYRLMLPARVAFLVKQFDRVAAGTPLYRYRSPQWPELEHEIVEANQSIADAQAKIAVAEATLKEARAKHEAAKSRIAELAAAEFRRADLEAQAAELAASIPRHEAELAAARTALTSARRAYEHALDRAAGAIGMTPETLAAPVEHGGETVPRYETIDGIEVKATEPGIVESLSVTDGTFADATTLLLTTVDPSKVRFRAVGLQSDLAKFSADQSARIIAPQAKSNATADAVEAKLTIGLDADPQQRTVTLFATPKELRPWMRPGVSAFLDVVTGATSRPVLAIPKSAVVQDGLTHVFFRRDPNDPNKAIRVEADLGIDDGRWVEVRSGLGPNDQVVLDGVYELKLATAQSGPAPKGGHVHADGTFHEEH